MTQFPENEELPKIIQRIQDLPCNSRERRKLWNALLKQISGYYLIVETKTPYYNKDSKRRERITFKEVRVPGILMPCEKLFDKDLNSLCGKKSRVGTPLRYLVSQKWMQEELYAQAETNTLLYIRENIDKYDAEKGTVKAWVNRTLCWKLLEAYNSGLERKDDNEPKKKERNSERKRIKNNVKLIEIEEPSSLDFLASSDSQEDFCITIRELIERDTEELLISEKLTYTNQKTNEKEVLSLKEILLMLSDGKTRMDIHREFHVPKQSLYSFIERRLKKKEIRKYFEEY